ncbi:MAG: Mini-ribonuclease 3 [Acutalibacteraceae bacterium]
MHRLLNTDCDPSNYSPLTLAYLGDSVFDLMVREKIVSRANRPAGELNKEKVKIVCCSFQARLAQLILPKLTQEEQAVYKRGRNAHSKPPKNASGADYHSATGFEALWGYLYLKGNIERLRELFSYIDSIE